MRTNNNDPNAMLQALMQQFQNNFSNGLSSCESKKPLAELGGSGGASILNYNLPQSTCFKVNNYIPLPFAPSYFKPETAQPPANNPWAGLTEIAGTEHHKMLEQGLKENPKNPLSAHQKYVQNKLKNNDSSIEVSIEIKNDDNKKFVAQLKDGKLVLVEETTMASKLEEEEAIDPTGGGNPSDTPPVPDDTPTPPTNTTTPSSTIGDVSTETIAANMAIGYLPRV